MHPRILALSALFASSCAGYDLNTATSEDTEASYRAFLTNHPESEETDEARARLEELAYQRAHRGDDIAAYNRFLAEFPEGDFAQEAIERRAELRLEKAFRNAEVDTLRRFLALNGDTRSAQRAREQLERLEASTARSSDDPEVLRAYLLSHPEGDAKRGIESHLDDVEYNLAKSANTVESFRGYLQTHTKGIHRAEALEALELLEADLAIAGGQLEALEHYLREHPGSVAEERVRNATASALINRAAMLLDPALAERVIELDPESPAAARAEALIAKTRRGGARITTIRGLIRDLAGPLELRGAQELRDALRSDHHEDRWNVVREIALARDPAVIDVAVEAAGSGDPMLLYLSRTALRSWTDTRAEVAEQPLQSWLGRLKRRSSNPEDLLRLGAVSESLSEPEVALRAYRTAAQHRSTALAASTHWALLAAEHGTQRERDEALETTLDVSRARLEEILDTIPDQLPPERYSSARQLLGGLVALEHLIEAIVTASQVVSPDSIGESELEEAITDPTLGELRQLVTATSATGRRLEARLARAEQEGGETGGGASLTERAAARRQQRVQAASRLGAMRAEEAIPALLNVASRGDGEVSRESLRALGRINTEEARTGLLELSRRPLQQHQAQELIRILRELRERRITREQREEIDRAIATLEEIR